MLTLIAHESVLGDVLPEPVVAASITTDHAIIKGLDPAKILSDIAGKLGLTNYEITDGREQHVPGHQLNLHLQAQPTRRKRR